MSPVPGFGPDSRESGPNRTRWTTKEVRWVVNERAMIVTAKTTIARKTVQLVRWSSRKAWVVQASSPLGHRTQPLLSPASESSHPLRFRATQASTPDRDADCESCVAPDSPNLSSSRGPNRQTSVSRPGFRVNLVASLFLVGLFLKNQSERAKKKQKCSKKQKCPKPHPMISVPLMDQRIPFLLTERV